MATPLPSVQAILDGAAERGGPDPEWSLPELREWCNELVLSFGGSVRTYSDLVVHDLEAPSADGPVPVRVYVPTESADASELGVHVHVHGGGWWMCSIETTEPMAREIAARTGLAVVSVEYRLAPEHPFPAGLNDVVAAVRWVASKPQALGFTPTSITLGGESAGSNLSAAAALRLRDEGDSPLAGLWLDVPLVDLSLPASESLEQFGSGYGLEMAMVPAMAAWYLGAAADGGATQAYVSPMHGDLSGLPQTLVTTAELDPLRDQGEAFADALAAAGVQVQRTRNSGAIHSSNWLTALEGFDLGWHDRVMAALAAMHRS